MDYGGHRYIREQHGLSMLAHRYIREQRGLSMLAASQRRAGGRYSAPANPCRCGAGTVLSALPAMSSERRVSVAAVMALGRPNQQRSSVLVDCRHATPPPKISPSTPWVI